MHELHLPAVGDIILVVLSLALAGAEAYFYREARRAQHLWTAMVLVGIGLFAAVMAFHYHVDVAWTPFVVRLESTVLVFTCHAWLCLVNARSTRPLPIRPAILAASLMVLVVATWTTGSLDAVKFVDIVALEHPLPRRVDDAMTVVVIGYGIAFSGLGVVWLRRHGRLDSGATWPQRGMLIWAACSLFDTVYLSAGIPLPLQLFEYGAFIFGASLTVDDLAHYVELLRTQRRDFQQLIEDTPDVVAIVRDGRVAYTNPALRQLRPNAEGARAADVFGFEADRLADKRAGASLESRLRGADGEIVHLEFVTLEIDFGQQPALVLVGRDVTDRDELTARAFELDRAVTVGTIASGLRHEINNPLAYAMSNLEELSDAAELDSEMVRDRMATALGGLRRIGRIVEGLGTFSRSAGDVRPTSVSEVVDTAVTVAANEVRQVATLVVDVPDGLVVLADFSRLGQVLINLLVNAAQAMGPGDPSEREIRVSVKQERDLVVFEVADSGPGIPEDALDRIFDLFYTTKTATQGTGLGLAISRESLRRMGGSLEARNRPEGGAVFQVTLRKTRKRARTEPRQARPSSIHRRGRVLLVDDEPELLRSLARLLRRDAELVTASSASEAIELLEGQEFDIVITDLLMPEMSGMDLHRWALEHRPKVAERMIFVTGGAFTPNARAFADKFRHRVLNKPFEMADLRDRIRRAVALEEGESTSARGAG